MAQNKQKSQPATSFYHKVTHRLFLTDKQGAPRFKATRPQLLRFSLYWAGATTLFLVVLKPFIERQSYWNFYSNPVKFYTYVMIGFAVSVWFLLQAIVATKNGPKWYPYYKRVRQKSERKKS